VQLVVILVDNAIKYSKAEGMVRVSVQRTDDEAILTVEDNGIGIKEEDQPLVWERFYKADKSHTKAAGGTGLGLAIAREIIDIHKARAVLVSRYGEGTKIEVHFPLAK
jgi:signal transduction histidine kinase